MTESSPPASDPLFEFVLYLITCARLHLEEKPIYGAFRMVEGASRLIGGAEDLTGEEADRFLREIRLSIEENKARMTVDKDGFREWLGEMAHSVTAEAVRRNQSSG